MTLEQVQENIKNEENEQNIELQDKKDVSIAKNDVENDQIEEKKQSFDNKITAMENLKAKLYEDIENISK